MMKRTKTLTKFRPRANLPRLAAFAIAFAWAVGIAATSGVAQPPQAGSDVDLNDGIPREVEGVTVEQRLGDEIPPELALTDSQGQRLRTGDWFDGELPTIVTLNYSSCPMLCNVQLTALTESLAELDLRLGEDFRVLTVSIDPHEPTARIAETKRSYVGQLENHPQADQGWVFCTATQPVIERLTDALGFRYNYDQQTGEYYHPAMLAFVSPEGIITRYSLKVNFPPDQVKLALVEAGEGNVGGAVQQFLLWCYTYDPDRNSYVPQAWKLMRLGGAMTIVAMLVFLLPYWVGRKRTGAQKGERGSSGDPRLTGNGPAVTNTQA